MQECQIGHSLSVTGRIAVRWCPECSRFELRVWAVGTSGDNVQTLIPEWAEVVRLEDDDWASRTLTKYITALAQTVRTLENDERHGVSRLPFDR